MRIYSHSKVGADGTVVGSKLLKDHILGVKSNAHRLRAVNLDFALEPSLIDGLLDTMATFHDFGKFTSFFQNYLLKKGTIDSYLKQHARVGGLVAYNMLRGKDEKLALIALFAIFNHHTQLCDIQSFTSAFKVDLERLFRIQIEDVKGFLPEIEVTFNLENIGKCTVYPDEKYIRRAFRRWSIDEPNIRDYFLVNYVFSLLIEADKLDASGTDIYSIKEIDSESVDKRFGKVKKENSVKLLTSMSNNEIRNYCRAEVVANIKEENFLSHMIFTLTAPTGIGKTMTALDFALKLKDRIKSELDIDARIIYALPFINIIEQGLKEYQDTLPQHIRVLAHYQFADVFGQDKRGDRDGDSSNEKSYNQKLMSLDTWQSDVVITSFVQFFETLIGNRNKLLKKFSHYANAIIILDEVQTLRLDKMPLIGASLYYLSKYLNSRILLMTATKPKIFQLAQEEILTAEGVKVEPFELLQSHREVFALYKRTRIVPLLDYSFEGDSIADDFVLNLFHKYWSPNKSCIIVCNTVNRSVEVYKSLVNYLAENNLENKVEYLSTNIIPAHRFERIERLRGMLVSGNAPILVSTQVVEAGVDLDFDMGFRDLGPIDSIIQVAGRINRNNNPQKHYSPLYIIDTGDARKIYGAITTSQASGALQMQNEFKEEEYIDLVDSYFENISNRSSFSRFNKIFESMKCLRYDSEDSENDMPVSSFKIIEESGSTNAVFIECDNTATQLRAKYLEKIYGKLSSEEFDEKYKTPFQQRIISIPSYLNTGLSPLYEFENSIFVVERELLDSYYDMQTGFVRKSTETVRML